MASIGDVVAALRRVVEDLPFAPLAEALDLVEDAKAFIEPAAAGSGQDGFGQVVARFEEVADGIGALQEVPAAIQRSATAAASHLEGQGVPRTVTPPPNQPGTSTPSGARSPPSPPSPERMGELLKALPVRDDPGGKTSGYWVDRTGGVQGLVESGRGELREQAVQSLRRLGLAPARGTLTVADHVEVQVAVQVREAGGADATLAVNNRPCDFGPLSCDRVVPGVLRPG
ncbi:DddA-like double-stranded DNA deaminase toxin [Actinosynnema sp. NPDC023587]|uniref:DddA-like double-stranded DNA deaminase toxin n=1 Tax=Actinosynnema sp. NPDC023587 TaxID=3154695 RepID=UPI0033F302F3